MLLSTYENMMDAKFEEIIGRAKAYCLARIEGIPPVMTQEAINFYLEETYTVIAAILREYIDFEENMGRH